MRMCRQLAMGKKRFKFSVSSSKKVQCAVFKAVCLSGHCMSGKCIWAKCDVETIFPFRTHFYCSFRDINKVTGATETKQI